MAGPASGYSRADRLSTLLGSAGDNRSTLHAVYSQQTQYTGRWNACQPPQGSPVVRSFMLRLFGEKLRFARSAHAMSQSALARHLGLAYHTHISHLEAGRRQPSLQLMIHIAQVLDVSPDYFLNDTIPVESIDLPAAHPLLASSHIGDQLRRRRKQRNLSQSDLVALIPHLTQGYISKLESGAKEPSPELLLLLAQVFSCPATALLLPNDASLDQE